MAGGRPRESIPDKEELIKLGEDLVAWASEKKEGELRCRWCEWYACKHFLLRKQWKRMIDTPEFRPYYEIAQPYLAQKWIDGTINQSIAHRYIRIYDPELKENEDEDAIVNASIKANSLKSEAKASEKAKQEVLDEICKNRKFPS